jgi:hypothetical protein
MPLGGELSSRTSPRDRLGHRVLRVTPAQPREHVGDRLARVDPRGLGNAPRCDAPHAGRILMVMMLTGKPLPLAKANGRACTLPLFPRNVTSAYTDVSPAAIATSCAPWLIAASGSTAATARFVDVQVVDAKLPVQSSSGPVPGLSFSRLRSPTRSCATAWAPPQAGGQPCGRSTRSLPWKPSISHDETLGSAKVSQVKGGTVRMFLRSGLKPAARMQNVAAKHLAAVWRGILIGTPIPNGSFPSMSRPARV